MSVALYSTSSTYAAVTDAIVVLLNLILPAPGSESVVVVEYVINAESPPCGRKSAIVVKSPEVSNPNALLALSVALEVNSDDVIVLVLDTLKDLSTCSCISCIAARFLSKALSTESAVNGSFSTKSSVCVCVVALLITTVSVAVGISLDSKTTLPPVAFPAPVTV